MRGGGGNSLDYFDLFFDEVMEFRRGLRNETDRGCALMAAAYLDDQLGRLLQSVLVDDAKAVDELLGPSGALGTFSSRIEACYALGLLPPMARRDLHLIRKVRNEFAHTPSPRAFEDSPIASRCSELHYAFVIIAGRARGKFTNAALGVCAVIHAKLARSARPDIASDANPSEAAKQEMRQVVDELAAEISRQEQDARGNDA